MSRKADRKERVMSTQYGGMSYRQTVQVPMWMIVALVVGAVAIGVGYTVERQQGQGAVATTTTATVFPGGLETSGVIPTTAGAVFPGGLETSGVISAAKVETTVPVGFSHVAPTTGGAQFKVTEQLSGGRNVTAPTSSTLPHGI
jgi:hypothetical protein